MDRTLVLLKNTGFLTIAELVKPFISFFFIIVVARILGVEGMGEYWVILTFVSFFEVLCSLGLSAPIIRGIAVRRHDLGKYFCSSIIIGTASSVISIGLLLLLLPWFNYPDSINIGIKILSASIAFFVVTEYMHAHLEGMQRMEIKSSIVVGEVIIRSALGILAVYYGYGVVGLIWTTFLSRLLVCAVSIMLVNLKIGLAPMIRMDIKLSSDLLKQAPIFLSIALLSMAYWYVDVLMLSKIKGVAEVGIYSSAYRIMDIVKSLSMSYIIALFPFISLSYVESKSSFATYCVVSVKYLFLATFPAVVGITILADRIITMLYGANFADAATPLRILIWTACLFPIALVFAKVLVASHNQKFDLLNNFFGVCLNVILNLILIPPYGYNGAAVATLISAVFFLCIQYAAVSYLLFSMTLVVHLFKIFIAGIFMAGVAFLCKDLHLVIAIALPASAYLVALFLLRVVTPEEMEKLRNVWGRVEGSLRSTAKKADHGG